METTTNDPNRFDVDASTCSHVYTGVSWDGVETCDTCETVLRTGVEVER